MTRLLLAYFLYYRRYAGLGALAFAGEMDADAGEAVFAIARCAGWLAHAMEEYAEAPLRFRIRARSLP